MKNGAPEMIVADGGVSEDFINFGCFPEDLQ